MSNIYFQPNASIHGYLCCVSNESMPGILKIYMINDITKLNEVMKVDSSDNLELPTPYKIELLRLVSDPIEKELSLHKLLSQYTERINPMRNFFRISVEEVKSFFEVIGIGKLWIQPSKEDIISISRMPLNFTFSTCSEQKEKIKSFFEVMGNGKLWIQSPEKTSCIFKIPNDERLWINQSLEKNPFFTFRMPNDTGSDDTLRKRMKINN